MAEIRKDVLQAKMFSFQWTIERFFADCEKVGDYYASPEFPVHYCDKVTSWYLHVHPKGKDKESEDCVSMFLHFQSENAFEVSVNYTCSIVIGQNSQAVMTRKGADIFKAPVDNWGWPTFVKQAVIKDTEKDALINDTVTILCEITFTPAAKDIAEKCYEYDGWQWISKSYRNTITYKELFESSSFSDMTFNVQGNEIHVHKAILSSHSPVFKAMFEHDMKEQKENLVNIKDIDYEVMKELLRFIYLGKVENIEKIVKELLIAVDKYSVTGLKALCELTFYGSLTVDNAIEYLKFVDMCDTLHLKKLTMKFVIDNLKDIIKMSNFNLLLTDLSSELVAEIMKAVAEKI